MGRSETFNVVDDFRNITAKVQKISNASHRYASRFLMLTEEILGFQIGVTPLENMDNQMTLGVYVGNHIIPIESMGEGVVNIIGLIVLLLTEDRKLYLIEEIENDIHPKALKRLLELIIEKSKSNQFIISTHSNIVLKYLGNEESKIFHLLWRPFQEKPEDKIPTTTISEIPNTSEAKLQLLENLGYDLFDFDLFKSYIILEESSAETLIRDFLIPEFTPSLKNKVKTIAATGADDLKARFTDLGRLFVFVHQSPIYKYKVWVMADGDSTGKRNIQSLQDSFTSWPKNHFINFSKNNIEDYYPIKFKSEFDQIQKNGNKEEKRKLKLLLTKKIHRWISKDPDTAKKEFAHSAEEIINYLREIELVIDTQKP